MESSSAGRHKFQGFLVAGKYPEKTAYAKPHEELANLHDDAAAQWFFHERWGPIWSESVVPEQKWEGLRAGGLGPPFPYLELRDKLRAAWRISDQHAQSRLIPADQLHSGDWSPFAYIEDNVGRYMKSAWVFRKGRIEIVPESLWSTICILFLRDYAAGKTAICANPTCHSPYFIKKRDTQIYCGNGDCMHYGHNKAATDYWNRTGKAERTKRQKKAHSRRRKDRP